MQKDSVEETLVFGDIKVYRLGLGTNRIRHDDSSKIALKKAVELGINFIDTGSAYTNGESEEVIGETLKPFKDIVVCTKGGMVRPDFRIDSRPETLDYWLENSLKQLKLKTIPLYLLHRVDPHVPLGESLLFLKQMQQEGKIKHIGLSQVSVAQIEEARKYVAIVAVENEYNLSERMYEDVVTYTEREKIAFLPFFPLHVEEPEFQVLQTMQGKYNATVEQLALAWLLKRSPMMLPIPGTRSIEHLQENIDAMKIRLSEEDYKKLSGS